MIPTYISNPKPTVWESAIKITCVYKSLRLVDHAKKRHTSAVKNGHKDGGRMKRLILILGFLISGYAMAETPATVPSTAPTTTSAASQSPASTSQPTVATAEPKKPARHWMENVTPFLMPLAVVITGGIISYRMQTEGLKQKYVEMAINVLGNNQSPPDAPIRDWAFKVLEKYAPIKFSGSNVDLPEEVTKGLARSSVGDDVFYSFSSASPIKAPSKGYFYSENYSNDPRKHEEFQLVSEKNRLFRGRVTSIRTFTIESDASAYGWLNGNLEVHIFDKSVTTPSRKIPFLVANGSGAAVFMMTEGQTAKVFNSSDLGVGRGNGMWDVLKLTDDHPGGQ